MLVKNVGISRRFFTNCYFFQLILTRFPRDSWASTNSGKLRCRFSRRIRGHWDRLLADRFLHRGRHDWKAIACRTVSFPTSILLPRELSRYGILPHPQQSGKMPLLPSCEVNDSISRVFAVLPEVAIRQRLTVFGHSFFVPQISKIALFFSPSHPPDGSRQVAGASCRIRGNSGRRWLLLIARWADLVSATLGLPYLAEVVRFQASRGVYTLGWSC